MSTILGNPITLGGDGLELVANVVDGATVTATLGSKTVTGISVGGQARLKIPQEGKWKVSATSGALVSVSQEISVPATIDIVLVSNELNDNSWAAIKQVSDANTGANFWSIGDCKEVTLNGTVSAGLTLSDYTAWVFIIGFDHNSEKEGTGIAFQGFKTAQVDGTDICLVDSEYGNATNTLSGVYFCMNTSDKNKGGWGSCKMRSNTMPLIKSAFPSELQSVIKTSTIYTDNTGGNAGNVTPTATEDEIFLLAEYEIHGSNSGSGGTTEEANYLKQYAYYSSGNSKVKYKHNSLSNAAIWWTRSPYKGGTSQFLYVTSSGGKGSGSNLTSRASFDYGVAPAFKV